MFKESKLQQIYCPNAQKITGHRSKGAFQDCKELIQINLPSLKTLGDSTF
jgi:hypothetical protein